MSKALKNIHVNLIDLLDAHRTGKDATIFSSAKKLRKYTIASGKTFLRDQAKEDGFINIFLVKLFLRAEASERRPTRRRGEGQR